MRDFDITSSTASLLFFPRACNVWHAARPACS